MWKKKCGQYDHWKLFGMKPKNKIIGKTIDKKYISMGKLLVAVEIF